MLGVPETSSGSVLLDRLRAEKAQGIKGGIYYRLQIDLTYSSNRIEGSRLSEEQTRLIFETRTLDASGGPVRVDDVVETSNHFRAVDAVIDHAGEPLDQEALKRLHGLLKAATADAGKEWFAVGAYKRVPNEAGGQTTTAPEDVDDEIATILIGYEPERPHTLEEIVDMHVRFERIHPCQDGNGRVGRLVMLRECLASDVVPFVITDDMKAFYYRGLREWDSHPGFLLETCRAAQDRFMQYLDYFRIPYAGGAYRVQRPLDVQRRPHDRG
ncbi:Fic family protein [Actinomyces slackii]|uniref:Fic/DOC family n=1 Tax=Actinomyces slackii TaxID=52774 RepID=A0A448KC52_9ACTO|nr:Fic family protein [Actinomyces slackii]VEG74509.1 Fic/DOC family [Actinomyces slackii]